MVLRLAVLVGGWFLLAAAPLAAQTPVSSQLYGTGVHAYFTGDYQRASELLTSAINTDRRDPRALYFRGLTSLKLGAKEQALQDFQQASKLETADLDRMYNISRSLERVQGVQRMLLEQYRAEARVKAFERAEQERKARYEALRREEERVLQQPPESAPVPAGPGLPVVPPVKFGEKGPPTQPPPPPGGTPPATTKPKEDIFGDPSAEPAVPAKPGAEAAPPTTPAKPPAPAKPAVPAKPADIFGDASAEPVAKAAPPTTPAKPAVAEVPAPEGAKYDFFAMPVAPPEKKAVAGKPAGAGDDGSRPPLKVTPKKSPTPRKGVAPGKPAVEGDAGPDSGNPFGDDNEPTPKKASPKKTTPSKKIGAAGGLDDESPFDDNSAPPAGKKATGKTPPIPKRAAAKNAAAAKTGEAGDPAAGGAAGVPNPFEEDPDVAPKKPAGKR